MTSILYKTSQIRNAIIDVLSPKQGKRYAISAFIGTGAEDYITNPKGLHLICWPKPGGTNPNILRKLIKKGVHVYFCNKLHIKLYYSKMKGAVLTSANLSNNALGVGNLHEIAIKLSPSDLDINVILNNLKYHKATTKELLLLEKKHNEFININNYSERSDKMSFKEWYESPHRSKWSICCWIDNTEVAKSAKDFTKSKYGKNAPFDIISNSSKSIYKNGDWVLTFTIINNKPRKIQWMNVDFVVKVGKEDKKAFDPENPYQYAQVWPLSRYETPPFIINSSLKNSLDFIIRKKFISTQSFENMDFPNKKLFDYLYKYYR